MTSGFSGTAEERYRQLKRLDREKNRRKELKSSKLETRRNILLGKLLCKYFPELRKYAPAAGQSDANAGVAEFESLLAELAGSSEFWEMIKTLSKVRADTAVL